MSEIIERIKEKIKNCKTSTQEDRARKGAYVDCIVMIKESGNLPEADSRNAVLGEGNAASLQPCETCKWNEGQISGMNIGCCNGYPCDSCRTDKWEPKD